MKMKIALALAFSSLLPCTFSDEPQNTHNKGSFFRQQKGESHVSPSIHVNKAERALENNVVIVDEGMGLSMQSRIVNGTKTSVDRYPYLAALYAKEDYGHSLRHLLF